MKAQDYSKHEGTMPRFGIPPSLLWLCRDWSPYDRSYPTRADYLSRECATCVTRTECKGPVRYRCASEKKGTKR